MTKDIKNKSFNKRAEFFYDGWIKELRKINDNIIFELVNEENWPAKFQDVGDILDEECVCCGYNSREAAKYTWKIDTDEEWKKFEKSFMDLEWDDHDGFRWVSVEDGEMCECCYKKELVKILSFKFDKTTGALKGYVDEIKNGLRNNDNNFNEYRNLVIPSEIDGAKVKRIGSEAFYDNHLTSVIIPNGIEYIGWSTFAHNHLTSALIPEGVRTIEGGAFEFNNLIQVTFPKSVWTIGNGAFEYNQLTSVIIPKGVKYIDGCAFMNNDLTFVNIPEGVITIGDGAFENNKLTEVKIPESVKFIGDDVFEGNPLTSVTIPEDIKCEYAFDDDVEVITNESSSSMKM